MSITTIAARTPQTTRTIARIIGGYAVDSADVALVLGFLSSQDGATRLRSLGGGLDRPEAWLGTDGRDFSDLREVAFLPLTEDDRALLGAAL